MRTLIVDDDFIIRSLLLAILSDYSRCDVAVNAEEADTAFKIARKQRNPYDLMFLDIIMPGENGTVLLDSIRRFEDERGFTPEQRCKIIMASSIDDPKEIMAAFKSQCDAYLMKPINKDKVLTACAEAGIKLEKI